MDGAKCETKIVVVSYVQRVLQPGEQVRHISSIHWIVYWPGVAVALLAVVAYWLSDTRHLPAFWRYTAYALALVAAVLLIQQWFQWWVTEIAATNRRVIYKKGLIRPETNEMNMDKVESVQINQSSGACLAMATYRSWAPAKASKRSAPSPARSSFGTASPATAHRARPG
jgi:hypothetical protein